MTNLHAMADEIGRLELELREAKQTFAKAMRQERRRRGVSLVALEELTHYSKSHLWCLENGRYKVSSDSARLIAGALDRATQKAG